MNRAGFEAPCRARTRPGAQTRSGRSAWPRTNGGSRLTADVLSLVGVVVGRGNNNIHVGILRHDPGDETLITQVGDVENIGLIQTRHVALATGRLGPRVGKIPGQRHAFEVQVLHGFLCR